MKRFQILALLIAAAAALGCVLNSCIGDDDDDKYADWRNANIAWYEQQQGLKGDDGSKFYQEVTADWDPTAKVLMHWFNDTSKTRDNIRPLYSSQVDVKYRGQLYDATPFDSSYLNTEPGDSLFRCRLNSSIIEGWAIAITKMRIGDSVRVVIPYKLAYKAASTGVIKPYSMLQFDIKLVAVPKFELAPKRN